MNASNRTIEAFDYIMNTRATYEELGQAVALSYQRNSRYRALNRCALVVTAARKDYRKNFAGETPPSWVTCPVNIPSLLAFAKGQADRFETGLAPNQQRIRVRVGDGHLEKLDAEICEECEESIPVIPGGGLSNKHHKGGCSLFDPLSN